jgi:valyl-tRNA synthetase
MSKSAGNGVDPIEVIDQFGADALRFNIITGNSPGNDMRFYVERCEAMRNFANKLWNAARYVMMNLTVEENKLPAELKLEDKWILSKLQTLIAEVNENFDKYELGLAATKIYDFIWDSFCDWYIEITKPRLRENDEGAQRVLLYVLTDILKLLHPFMPYITEEIYDALPHEGDALIVADYPEYDEDLSFPQDEADFESIMTAVKAIRSRRAEMNVPPSKRPHLIVETAKVDVFEKSRVYLANLAFAGEVQVTAAAPADTTGMVTVVTEVAKLYMPMAELVDLAAERARIEKELAKAQKDIENQEKKLANENFVSRAPEHVVAAEREKLQKAQALATNLAESLKNFG